MKEPRPQSSRRPESASGNFKAPGGRIGLRRQAREAALQCLFQLDAQGFEETSADAHFWKLRSTVREEDAAPAEPAPVPLPQKARSFTESLVSGVCAERGEIDALLEKFAANFRLERLAAVDRNILRLAIYELLHPAEAPAAVVINEAIEIAKRFGSEDSGRFVNGLLDRIRLEIRSAAKTARPSESPAPAPESAPAAVEKESAAPSPGPESL
jgi:N utilization substance protein B